jgi:predicted transcriptional regulator
VGLITFRAVLARPRATWASERVADRMVPFGDALVLDADARLDDAFPDLVQAAVGRALVRDDDRPFGLLPMTEVARLVEARRGRAAH